MNQNGSRGDRSPLSGQANYLLRNLDEECLRRLQPLLKRVELTSQEVLYRPEQKISDIYFPDTAVTCMLTIMEDGRSIESATVGNEGASWISASIGAPTMPCQTMVAVGGSAHKMSAKHVEEEIRRNGLFHDLLSEYSHALLISSLRTGACNSLHSLLQRCSRWMLMTLDRTPGEQFVITHEFLASLLGCGRATLTGILSEMEQAGSIHTRRGLIELKDRRCLEQSACECYQRIRETFEELRERQERLGAR